MGKSPLKSLSCLQASVMQRPKKEFYFLGDFKIPYVVHHQGIPLTIELLGRDKADFAE